MMNIGDAPGRCKACGRTTTVSDYCSRPDCDSPFDEEPAPELEPGEDIVTPEDPGDPRTDDDMRMLGRDSWWG
jgi:hypothetical protein